MWQNIVRVIFIVLFALTLAFTVVFGLRMFEGGDMLRTLLCVLVASLCIYRIVYYALGLAHRNQEE
jgi:hypothetical protein